LGALERLGEIETAKAFAVSTKTGSKAFSKSKDP
jgi:hypothetical protein